MADEKRRLVSEPQPSTSRSPDYNSIEADSQNVATVSPENKGSRCFCVCISLILTAILLGGVTILVVLLVVIGGQPPRVLTSCGQIEGKFDVLNHVFIFKGIPYAVPPIGERRWKAPEMMSKRSKTCWEGMYHATSYKDKCIQRDDLTKRISGSEDCLYLNIFSPTMSTEKTKPVMVFIHGGDELQTGYASLDGYSPYPKLADRLGMVLVSVQYRLNAFGYLTLNQIGKQAGNFGLQDQILALKWVRDNIGKFGGNRNQVTLLGQGSGATSVLALLATPKAVGLFQRAWMMSPSPRLNTNISSAIEANQFFLDKTHSKTKEELYDLKDTEVVKTIYPEWKFIDRYDLPTKNETEYALLVVDGEILPESPIDVWKKKKPGTFSDVPVIIGSTAQEIDVNPVPGSGMKSWSEIDYEKNVAVKLNTFDTKVTNASLIFYPYKNGSEVSYTSMASDIRVTCGVNVIANAMATAMTSPVYRYVVTAVPSSPIMYYGSTYDATKSFSGFDLLALLDTLDSVMSGSSPSSKNIQFGNLLRNNFYNFAKDGKPSSTWGSYPNNTALLNDYEKYMKGAYRSEECQYYNENGVTYYSWQN